MSQNLLESAWTARENAYAPYSNFKVGCAILDADGFTHVGCNVENISYGLTICAERNALAAAIAKGAKNFTHLVVVADTDQPISPCGACRQVMAEFEIPLITLANRHSQETFTLAQLLPRPSTGILNHP